MIYFTSDLHLNHANIIKYSNRPFSSVEQMDKTLIDNFNSVVKKGDTVYDLGDFCFGNAQDYLSQMNGTIIRIKGSHDRDIQEPRMIVLELPEHSITLCHYAMRTWEKSHYASYHLFGHSHNTLPAYGLSFDVGVDCWDYYPVSLTQVEEKMNTLRPIVDYRK